MVNNQSDVPSMVCSKSIEDIQNTIYGINESTSEATLFDDSAQLTYRHIASIYEESNKGVSPEDYFQNFFIPVIRANIDPYQIFKEEYKKSFGCGSFVNAHKNQNSAIF